MASMEWKRAFSRFLCSGLGLCVQEIREMYLQGEAISSRINDGCESKFIGQKIPFLYR